MRKYGPRILAATLILAVSCSKGEPVFRSEDISSQNVSLMLSRLPLSIEHVREVHDAVEASASNGYDQEYTFRDMIESPGKGVGDIARTKAPELGNPLREILKNPAALANSGLQIYWPYSDSWDGVTMPVITFDPGDFCSSNVAYTLDGEKLLVDEMTACERPVWVVNRNTDAGYTSLELLRREDPSWGHGGGDILVRPGTKAGSEDTRTLVLRSFKAKRQFDSWLAGGSEFLVKIAAIDDFWPSTEAELRLYQPSITDFMIVVKRSQVNQTLPFNAILISNWTSSVQTGLESCAFMIHEDDGGTRTNWKCSAVVKYNSKSYGFEVDLPINSRDDIVWRGSLDRKFIEKNSGKACRFGDVEAVLELIP